MTAGTLEATAVEPHGRWHENVPVAGVLLLLAYLGLSLFNSPDGFLGTDTGAKVATLDVMVENDTFRPDVGYWAAEWDPDATYHPLFDTEPTENGEYVNVTTLPMLVAAKPLYELGGYRLTLLLPMMGSVAAAFASRDIARRLGSAADGWRTFWVAGLAGPLCIYALDLWEHAVGAGLMLWAIAFLLRVVDGASPLTWSLLAGLAFGASASMRTETFVVALVAVATSCVVLVAQRRIVGAIDAGIATVVGFSALWLANAALESWLDGNPRSERVGDRVGGASAGDVVSELGDRIREALITWFAVPNMRYPARVLIGIVAVALLMSVYVFLRRRDHHHARLVLVGSGSVLAIAMLAGGPAFVPGAFIAAPAAVLAFWGLPRHTVSWVVLVIALVATVLIWQFQFLGGAEPQWGGRYILVPTSLLVIVGVVRLGSLDRFFQVGVVALAVLVTFFGVAWLAERSNDVDRVFDDLAQQPEDVIISTNGFFVREAGASWNDRRYLSVGRGGSVEGAVGVVDAAGFDRFAVLGEVAVEEVEGARLLAEREVEAFGIAIPYRTYSLRGR